MRETMTLPANTDPASGATAPPAASPSSPTPTPPVSNPASSDGSGAAPPATGGAAAPITSATDATAALDPKATGTAPAAAAPAQPSWLSQLRESGVDLGTEDESAARTQLAQMHKDWTQLRQLQPYLTAYMHHAPKFTEWLTQQQAAAKPAPTPGQPSNDPFWKPYFNPPEYNPAWEKQIVRDDKGNLMPAPGAPADVVARYQAYQQFRQDHAERFLQNPHEYMAPTIQHIAKQVAEQLIRDQLSQRDNQSSNREFLQQNSAWLYELDATGQPKTTPTFNPMSGQMVQGPVLSQWGQLFQKYAKDRQSYQQQAGYAFDERDMKDYALAMVQRDYAIHMARNPQAATPPPGAPGVPAKTPQQAANDAFLKNNNPPAAQPGTNGNTVPKPVEVNRMNLEQVLAERMKGIGIS
jgi:hypothetical protein